MTVRIRVYEDSRDQLNRLASEWQMAVPDVVRKLLQQHRNHLVGHLGSLHADRVARILKSLPRPQEHLYKEVYDAIDGFGSWDAVSSPQTRIPEGHLKEHVGNLLERYPDFDVKDFIRRRLTLMEVPLFELRWKNATISGSVRVEPLQKPTKWVEEALRILNEGDSSASTSFMEALTPEELVTILEAIVLRYTPSTGVFYRSTGGYFYVSYELQGGYIVHFGVPDLRRLLTQEHTPVI